MATDVKAGRPAEACDELHRLHRAKLDPRTRRHIGRPLAPSTDRARSWHTGQRVVGEDRIDAEQDAPTTAGHDYDYDYEDEAGRSAKQIEDCTRSAPPPAAPSGH